MKITYLPHALRRMDERRIAQWEVAAVLEAPAVEYPGHVFTVELGRPTRHRRGPAEPEGGE
jgi:hypothetical protein